MAQLVDKSKFVEQQTVLTEGLTRNPIVVRAQEYKGKQRIDIRSWYYDKAGELQATREGVNIPVDLLDEMINALVDIKEAYAAIK